MIFIKFLSTLSLRRATLRGCPASSRRRYFYPRSPCGERLNCYIIFAQSVTFLSTLSLRRATSLHRLSGSSSSNFYPRSPCGERLHAPNRHPYHCNISIHALLAESDIGTLRTVKVRKTFLSTLSLRRATSKKFPPMCIIKHFYPRSPCGERLVGASQGAIAGNISIHALLAESDYLCLIQPPAVIVFLSTLSLRRATCCLP